MSRNKILPLLLLIAIAEGCSKMDVITTTTASSQDSSTLSQLSFGAAIDWTKCIEISDMSDMSYLTLYTFDVDHTVGWADASASDISSYLTEDSHVPFDLQNINNTWWYSDYPRYWRGDGNEAITLVALYPRDELEVTFDEVSGKPILSYSLNPFAYKNCDLLCDARFDMNDEASDSGTVSFDLQHALTKLSLKVILSGEVNDNVSFDNNNTFIVDGITLYGLYSDATLDISLRDDGSRAMSWSIDTNYKTVDLTTEQGYTISSAELNATTYTDVVTSGCAIFVLPQELGSQRETPPMVQLHIRRSFYPSAEALEAETPTEIIYTSERVEIPAATGSTGWEVGQHNVLLFTFELDNIDQYDTPLTVFSQLYDWTEATVDVEIAPNTYIYVNANTFEVVAEDISVDVALYTNYAYDMRAPKRLLEIDGTPTTANGFTLYHNASGSNTPITPLLVHDGMEYSYEYNDENELYLVSEKDKIAITTDCNGDLDLSPYEDESGWLNFKVKPIADDDTYDITYSALKTDRATAGLYTATAAECDDDAVYILRFDIEAGRDGDICFTDAIGAEMIATAGGLVSYKFNVELVTQ